MNSPELKKIEETLDEFPFPKKVAFELNADCNYNCIMCHHDKMIRPKGVMPFPLFQKCADEIAYQSPDTECWFSFCGEPLLEPELLIAALKYGKSVGLRSMNINTNGLLFKPELCDRILDTGVDLIVFGLDGFSKETYEKIRVNGNRDEVYQNIEHLILRRNIKNSKTVIQLQFIVMDENEHELDDFKEYWNNHEVVLKIRNKLSWGGKFETPLAFSAAERIPCPWAITMMHIFWDGRIPRCPGDTEGEEGFGNAWHESLASLWKQLGTYRQLHLEHRYDELPERCKHCKDWMTGAAERIKSINRKEMAHME